MNKYNHAYTQIRDKESIQAGRQAYSRYEIKTSHAYHEIQLIHGTNLSRVTDPFVPGSQTHPIARLNPVESVGHGVTTHTQMTS
jgi:hypothetical protein